MAAAPSPRVLRGVRHRSSSPRMSPSRRAGSASKIPRARRSRRRSDAPGAWVDLVSRLLLSFDGDDAEDRARELRRGGPLPAPVPRALLPDEDEVGATCRSPGADPPTPAMPPAASRWPAAPRPSAPRSGGISPEPRSPVRPRPAREARGLRRQTFATRRRARARSDRASEAAARRLLTDATWTTDRADGRAWAQIIGRRFKVAHACDGRSGIHRSSRGGRGGARGRGRRGAARRPCTERRRGLEERTRRNGDEWPSLVAGSLFVHECVLGGWRGSIAARAEGGSRDFARTQR